MEQIEKTVSGTEDKVLELDPQKKMKDEDKC
jgi:hypothetical protein